MIYQFSLQSVGIAVGIFLLFLGFVALFRPALSQDLARKLPRSRVTGIVLLTLALIWNIWLLATIEMGEFSRFRRPLLIALPIGYFLVLRFVDEFLAVRALGILCLLAAEPLLDQINWGARSAPRWRLLHGVAFCYGAAILAFAFTQY